MIRRFLVACSCAAIPLLASCRDGTGPEDRAPSALAVTPDSVRVATVGDTARLQASLTDDRGNSVGSVAVTWSSSDTTVAVVSGSGTVRAVRYGSAVVTARAGTLSREVPVQVGERGVERWSAAREPTLTSSILRAIWGTPDGNVFVGGTEGAMLRYDGSRWSTMESGTTAVLIGMWGSSGSDIWAVGYNDRPGIVHFDGTRWTAVQPGVATQNLLAVSGTSASDVFAVGYQGKILHYDGTLWTPMESGTTTDLFGVWAASPSDVYAVGRDGVLHYDGTRWSPVQTGGLTGLLGVWGTSASDVYVSGAGVVAHFDGRSWSRVAGDGTYFRVWGTSARDVYATGLDYRGGPRLLHSDGSGWTVLSTADLPQVGPEGIWGASPGKIFLVGGYGLIAQGSGSRWSVTQYGPPLNDVWGAGTDFAVAVGENGFTVRYDGSRWNPQEVGSRKWLYSVGGRSRSEVYAVGLAGYRYDGVRWDSIPNGAATATWVDPAGRVYLLCSVYAGSFRNTPSSFRRWIERREGGVTTVVWGESGQGGQRTLSGIWGRSENDVYVVGSEGKILHFDGTAWTEMSGGGTAALRAVGGGPSGAVFAVGNGGVVLRYEGGTWTPVESGTTQDLLDVWASSESNVYAVGSRGTILRFDGRRWTRTESGTTLTLRGVWGASSTEVYAVGDQGVVLRGAR